MGFNCDTSDQSSRPICAQISAQSRAVVTGPASHASAALAANRSRAAALAEASCFPRSAKRVRSSAVIARLTASVIAGSDASASAEIEKVDILKTLKVLIIGFDGQVSRRDRDGLDRRLRDAAEGAMKLIAHRVKRAEEIAHLEAENHIGFGNRLSRAGRLIEWMSRGKIQAPRLIHHAGLQRFGKLDEGVSCHGARRAIGDDHGTFGRNEQTRQSRRSHRCRRAVATTMSVAAVEPFQIRRWLAPVARCR